LLNSYLDNIIKGKEKDLGSEDEIDEVLGRVVALFSYLQDKDEFFEYFRKALCKRLLSKTKQYNENSEKSFLSKLKGQSGDAAIRKLQGMFTDVQEESISDLKQKFEQHNGGSKIGPVELEVTVLNDSHWPISSTQKFPLYLGKELDACMNKFQTYYDSTTEKKKLTWLFNYGTVTLNARFTNSKTPISLVLTPLQASIMMCFNEAPKLTFQEIATRLWPQSQPGKKTLGQSQGVGNVQDMSLEEILRFAIQPLVYFKYKILSKENDVDPKKESVKKNRCLFAS